MPRPDVERLYAALRETLAAAAPATTASPPPTSRARKVEPPRARRFGQACPECGDEIRQVTTPTRPFQYCPTCQTGGKRLSDRVMDRLLK